LTWSQGHGLRKAIPGKPWDWITLKDIPWAYAPPWYVPYNDPPKDRLTFGVELEISLGCITSKDQKDPDEGDTREIYGKCTTAAFRSPLTRFSGGKFEGLVA
jgi:hypothetical protein